MEAEISDCKSDCKISVDDGDTSIGKKRWT